MKARSRETDLIMSCGCYLNTTAPRIPRVLRCPSCERKVHWTLLPKDSLVRAEIIENTAFYLEGRNHGD